MLRNHKTARCRVLPLAGTRRRLATYNQADVLGKYPVGLKYHGFTIEDVKPVPEFSLVAVKLKHDRTGGQHLHLDAPHDKNNVFSIAFKTNPPDATGVPHILEHTTLCGSYKYPVRDPFFKMLNRSLSNFMNAMTGHDYTFFPFATTNAKDFENLMDVYLSSVLEPLLTYEDFTQEGWRLENEVADDISSPLTFKGVVYNEMKGQYSNSSYYFYIKFQEAIYSSLNNSGGDPKHITDLQYEDLIDFQASNYHPSNARTFTYGSLPLFDHLKKLDATYGPFGARARRNVIRQPALDDFNDPSKSHRVVTGPFDAMSGKPQAEQYQSSITWYLGNPLDESKQYELLKWKVLNTLLCDGHSSPFYQELIETEYGDDFTPNSGLDSTTALLSFTIGLNGLTKDKAESLEAKVKQILQEKVLPEFRSETPVFKERVEAILHQVELNFKRHKPDFGLSLLSSVVPTWVNGLNPLANLQVETILQKFKADFNENGLKMFEEMLNSTIANESAPSFKFTMVPDETFSKSLIEEESQRLQKKTSNLTEEDKEVILERSKKLAKKQQEQEDVSVLPTLTLGDIPRQGDNYPLEFSNINDKKLQKRIVDTNGLVYANAAKDLSYLPTHLYPYMPLFISCLTNLAGTTETPIIDLETKIQKLTGGVSFSFANKPDPFDVTNTNLKLVLSGMALAQNSRHIYELWNEILTKTKFNNEPIVIDKLNTLIKSLGQNQMNNIADRGHTYAGAYSGSLLTVSKQIRNQLSGIAQVDFIMNLNKNLEARGKQYLEEEVLPVLQQIQELLVSGFVEGKLSGFNYNITSDATNAGENEKLIQKFDDSVNTWGSKPYTDQLKDFISNFNKDNTNVHTQTLINLPFQVGYTSLARLGAAYVTKDGAALQVLSQLMSFKHLHSVIRESNGAYGGGLTCDGVGGTMNYYSYRDPNPIKSIGSFRDAAAIALSKLANNWDSKDLQEAKLAIFQSVDAPSHISQQGLTNFLDGITDDMRQERRERFLDINNEDLKNVTEKYLISGDREAATVIADQEKTAVGDGWTIKNFVHSD